MKNQPNLDELIKLAKNGGNDASLILYDKITGLENQIETLKSDFTTTVDNIKSSVPDLNKILETIKGKDAEPPSDTQLLQLIQPLIPEPIKGDTYVLTDEDKMEIAMGISVPIVERIETIREQPIVTELVKVTNEIKEVAVTDTPDVILQKVNSSDILIRKERVEGLVDLMGNVAHNVLSAMPVTTSFFNGLRGKNLNIIGATATQSGDTVSINLSGFDPSVTLADVSANSLTTPNSLYTMTSTIPVEFKTSSGARLLYLDETNKRVGVGPTAPTEDFMVSTTTGPVAIRLKSGDSTAGLILDGGGSFSDWGIYTTSVGGVASLGFYDSTNGAYRWAMDSSGHFVAGTDNTYDIGKSGALRPRSIYAGTNMLAASFRTSNGTQNGGDVRFGSSQNQEFGSTGGGAGTVGFYWTDRNADSATSIGGSYNALNLVTTGATIFQWQAAGVTKASLSIAGKLTLSDGLTVGSTVTFADGSTWTSSAINLARAIVFNSDNARDIGAPGGAARTLYAATSVVTSGLTLGYVAKTSTYTVAASDYTIDCTSGTFTVNLPAVSGTTGRIYVIKNSGTGVITIDGNGSETIDGSLTQSLSTQYASYMIQSTGSAWIII